MNGNKNRIVIAVCAVLFLLSCAGIVYERGFDGFADSFWNDMDD